VVTSIFFRSLTPNSSSAALLYRSGSFFTTGALASSRW
jgi:hypothetical protein